MSAAADERPPLYHDLIERLGRDGCALCWLAHRAAGREMWAAANEGVNDLELRERLRASRGYCERHARQFWREVRHPLGVAMIYQDVVINLVRALESADPAAAGPLERLMSTLGAPRARAAADAASLEPVATCPACAAEADSERRALAILLPALAEAEFAAAYRAGPGLCLPHFRRALARCRRDEEIAPLVEVQLAAWRGLYAELSEFIRLQDYRFRAEPRGAEQASPRRALELIAGDREQALERDE